MRLPEGANLYVCFFFLLISFGFATTGSAGATLNNRWSRRECSKKRGGGRYFSFFFLPTHAQYSSFSISPFLLRGEAGSSFFSVAFPSSSDKRDTGALYIQPKKEKKDFILKRRRRYISADQTKWRL